MGLIMLTEKEQAVKDKWIADLRSGNYRQARETLYDVDSCGYCCLGVLQCGVMGVVEHEVACGYEDMSLMVPSQKPSADFYNTRAELGWVQDYEETLMEMNDTDGRSFNDIADFIEENWV